MPNPKPNLSHIKVYGSCAYVKTNNIPKKDKIVPRTHFGYLVRFDSTTIFRIWIPGKNIVERVRNVTFDESLRYEPNEPHIDNELQIQQASIIETIRVPELQIRAPTIPDDDDIPDDILDEINEAETDGSPMDTPSDSSKSSNTLTPLLPTPEATPPPDASETMQGASQEMIEPGISSSSAVE
jgi:hypothetical protein